MLDDLCRIVDMESPSSHKPSLDLLGTLLAEKFAALGGEVKLHAQAAAGDHLQVDFPGKTGRPVMLLGHFDTVWDIGTLATMPFRIEKDRAFGPGIFDMKGGIVIMLHAIALLQQLDVATIGNLLPRPVTVFLSTDEEVGSTSSRVILEEIAARCAAVLVLEPAGGAGLAKTSRKGVGDYRVKVTGVPSHAGLDFEKGHSAILELSRQILEIAKFTDLERGITVSPGVVHGGTRTNVVPAEAFVEVDVRISKMKDAAELDQRFRALKPFDEHCRIEITGGVNRPPLERSDKVVRLFHQARGIAQTLNFELGEMSVGGGSDGNFTAALGIPTLDGLGAVGEGAHAPNESVVVSELPRRAALVAGLIAAIEP